MVVLQLIVVTAFCGYAAFMITRMYALVLRLVTEAERVADQLTEQKSRDAAMRLSEAAERQQIAADLSEYINEERGA